MVANESTSIAQWQLAHALTELRGSRPQRQFAKELDVDASTLARWEGASSVPRERQLRKVLAHCGVPAEETERIVALRTEASAPAWWQDSEIAKPYGQFIGLERSASQIATYQDRLVPGLLQTEDYARAIFEAGQPRATSETIDGLLQVRLARQETWEKGQTLLWAIIDEAALLKHVGGARVMHAQVQHLISMAKHPRIDLQVLPNTAGAHIALQTGSFVIVEVEKPAIQAVYVEAHTRNTLLDDPKEVTAYKTLMDHLRAAAANTPDTRDHLTRILKYFQSYKE